MFFYKIKLKYKNFLLMLGVLFGLKLNAVTLQDAEKLTAFARFPAVVGANVLEQQKGVAPKLARVIVDLVRLSNEILSIANNSKTINGTIHYDAPWAAYDLVSLGLHVKDLFAKQDLVEPDNSDLDLDDCLSDEEAAEVKKLSDKLRTMHEVLLPVLEAATAFLAATGDADVTKDAKFRLRFKSINSMIRLADNIIVSEYKSREQLLWAGVLLLNALFLIYEMRECFTKDGIFYEWFRIFRSGGIAKADAYAVLGIAPGASEREIRRAYRQRARGMHPDRGGNTEAIQRLNDAYACLIPKAKQPLDP